VTYRIPTTASEQAAANELTRQHMAEAEAARQAANAAETARKTAETARR
jgi:hypothetical protein